MTDDIDTDYAKRAATMAIEVRKELESQNPRMQPAETNMLMVPAYILAAGMMLQDELYHGRMGG